MLIYISCPVTVPESTFKNLLSSLENRYPNHRFIYWRRGTKYDSEMVKKANAVAVILPNIAFRSPVASIPSGVLNEIGIADTLDIPLMVVYRMVDTNNVFIYDAELGNYEFKGVAGTSSKYIPRVELKGTAKNDEITPIASPISSSEHTQAFLQAWEKCYPTARFDPRILLLV